MADRRQGDRREQTAATKKIEIPFLTFIFSIVLVIVIGLLVFICIGYNRVGYKKGYEEGYTEGITASYYMSLLDTVDDDRYSVDVNMQ